MEYSSLTPHESPIMVSPSSEENGEGGRKSPEADSPEKSEGALEAASSPVPLTWVRMKKRGNSLPHAVDTAEDPGGESALSPAPRTWKKMKKSKCDLPPSADVPEKLTKADPPVLRTWATMKKRPHASDAPEKPASSAKRKKGKHHAGWNNKVSVVKNPQQAVEERQFVSSLTEPELGLLISLKQLAERRAQTVKQSALANKFDLRVLRALGFVLLEYFKEECKKASVFPDNVEISSVLNQFNLAVFPDNAETSSGVNQFNLAAQSIESNAVSPGSVACDNQMKSSNFVTPQREWVQES